MDDLKGVKCTPMLEESLFVKPYHMYFTQNGHKRRWDLLRIHNSVAILIFNVSRQVLVFVKQFRPAVYLTGIPDDERKLENDIDTSKYPASLGFTLELCAGIVDKPGKSLEEIACEEVEEECGYSVAPSALQRIISYRSGVGISGDKQTVFYAEVTDDMKIYQGGGNAEEGELIEVVELTIEQAKDYMAQPDVLSPGGFLFALTWFFRLKNIA